ncbi:metal-dependent hydrolase [Acinetobacter sp. ANC 4648]|uniref:metal-dependent hydrolase n=1 Tax=Acinetobacter sp. ANC 4648 TaxID=1977875 RepID=UPI000A35371A|nr:metal-dependent hydrolase [Acinetobacter sp. ANC 4648]OTG80025.1 metal-dependent hydrolase [Acinetobacter sp. ANC 4648]
MTTVLKYQVDPVVRKTPNFKLDQMPRFWFGGDPFRTRMFDALSLTFPMGERYFVESVRALRHKVTDPNLQNRIIDFIQQEAQHGLAHDTMNRIIKQQGIPVDHFLTSIAAHFNYILKNRTTQYNIAMTAATEHLTALMADTFYGKKSTLTDVHPYIRALFAWHAIEEMEHRDVAFDVMQQAGEVSESLRKFALAYTSILIFGFTFYRANIMLKYDGFSTFQRIKMAIKGLPWFFGKQGSLSAMHTPYMNWFNKGFHPNQHPIIRQYQTWVDTLEQTGDPIAAGEAFWHAAL